MSKYVVGCLFILCLSLAYPHESVQAATRAEMLQQIEQLTKLVLQLQAQLQAKKQNAVGINYIESGEVVMHKGTKTARATVMFGLADLMSVQFTYTNEKAILDEVLAALNKKRPNVQYVDRGRIRVNETATAFGSAGTMQGREIYLVPISTSTADLPKRPDVSPEVSISPEQQKRYDFADNLARCSSGKTYSRNFGSEWGVIPAEAYSIVGKSGDMCKLNYTHSFSDVRTKKVLIKVVGSCTFDPRRDVLGDPLEVSSLLPYMTLLHEQEPAQRSKVEQQIYEIVTMGDYEGFVQKVEEREFGISCVVKSTL